MHVFQNEQVAFTVSERGAIVEIANRAAGEVYRVREDFFRIETDAWILDSRRCATIANRRETNEVICAFQADGGAQVEWVYRHRPDRPYLERTLVIRNGPRPLTLRLVEPGHTAFEAPPAEMIPYDTFWQCPTVAFLRWPKGGLFAGIENPFFATRGDNGVLAQSFAPGMVLKPGETYESEPQFIGVYRRSGVMIADHLPKTVLGRRPRFFNPCGHLPLDRSEIRAMQRLAADYLAVPTRTFHFILYNFFYPLPRMPKAGSPEEKLHLKMLDTFKALGGDVAILNPMFEYHKPEGRPDAFWDLAPEGTGAGNILRHAQALGIGSGFYTGCAFHGAEGNAAALPFAPERTEWKKTDDAGNVAAENCMACDEYAAWFLAVQANTIRRYGLRVWDWDPGPGNGFFCHNAAHGHLPGQGGYKGWRNATELMRRLRDEFPGIYFQAFYGRKEYGLWGFRHFDQHESYCEVSQAFGATMHPHLHADRVNADQIRLQAYWNQTFRFHPPQLSHSMTHRQQEGHWDPRLSKTWDTIGWKYSFMSTLASCGSVLVTILPEDLSLAPGMREFYARWLGWAREHYDGVAYSIPFGEQLRPGCVDGWARIKGDGGFVFLCNPNPRPARVTFGLDDEIGLTAAGGRFALTELYPVERRARGVFEAGAKVSLVVPANEVVLLELAAAAAAKEAAAAPAAPAGLPPRALDDWRRPDGSRFVFPRHTPEAKIAVETAFMADTRIRERLAAARPPNLAEIEPLIPGWKQEYPDNFAWARPDRLWLVIPFADADRVGTVSLRVNGNDVPAEGHVIRDRRIIHYADITDAVRWGATNRVGLALTDVGENQFLGPYLDYPAGDPAAEALAAETAPVVFDGRPLDPDTPGRAPAGPKDTRAMPVVTSLRLNPGYYREGETTRVLAAVNLPPEQLEAVYLSAGPWWNDEPMRYDAQEQAWVYDFTPPARWGLIMDVPRHAVWAVAKNGLVGQRARLEIRWRFGNR